MGDTWKGDLTELNVLVRSYTHQWKTRENRNPCEHKAAQNEKRIKSENRGTDLRFAVNTARKQFIRCRCIDS